MPGLLVPLPELEITPVPTQSVGNRTSIFDLTEQNFARITTLAKWLAMSSFSKNGARSEQDYALIMLKGLELGILPLAAVDLISIISGKPVLDAKGLLALVKQSGLLETIKIDQTDNACSVTLTRKGEEAHTETFTMDDAKKMGLDTKQNWKSQPRVMLKWRAVASCVRIVFPDIIGGLYTHEELDAENAIVREDGGMTTAQPAQLPASTTPETPAKPWHEDSAKVATIIIMAKNKGYGDTEEALLNLLGKPWSDFETGKLALTAIEAEHNKLLDAEKHKSSVWSKAEETKLRQMIDTQFARKFEDIFTLPEADFNHDLTVYSSANSAWSKLIPAVIKAGWAVTSSHLTYVAGKGANNSGARLEFDTAIGKISIFSRKDFIKMVGEGFAKKFPIAEMQPGELVIDPVLIQWETNKSGHRAIVSAKPVNPINEHIEEAISNVINGLDNDEPAF